MENKDKVLEQLDNIHNYMVDSEDSAPFDSNIFLLWAFASAIMFLGFEVVLGFGVFYSIFFVVGVNLLAYIVQSFMVSRENYKYDIAKMTHNQIITNYNYIFAIVFAIVLTSVFTVNGIGKYSYPSWIFLIAFANFNTGLVLNKNNLKIAGIFGLIVGGLMFGLFLYFGMNFFGFYDKVISAIVCSGSLAYISVMLKESNK